MTAIFPPRNCCWATYCDILIAFCHRSQRTNQLATAKELYLSRAASTAVMVADEAGS